MKKLALIALFAAAPAFAGDLYFVGSVGQSNADINKSEIDADVSEGLTGFSSSLDDTDTGYKLQLGYQYNKYLGVEAGYIDFGKAKYSASANEGSGSFDWDASGWNVDLVGTLPINDAFSVFGKVGTIYARVKTSGDAVDGGEKTTDWKASFGVGATYNINKQLGIRAEYQQFNDLGDNDKTGEADVSLFSVGVSYKF